MSKFMYGQFVFADKFDLLYYELSGLLITRRRNDDTVRSCL